MATAMTTTCEMRTKSPAAKKKEPAIITQTLPTRPHASSLLTASTAKAIR